MVSALAPEVGNNFDAAAAPPEGKLGVDGKLGDDFGWALAREGIVNN